MNSNYSEDIPLKDIAAAENLSMARAVAEKSGMHFLTVEALVERKDCTLAEAFTLLEDSDYNEKVFAAVLAKPEFSALSFSEAAEWAEKCDYRSPIVSAILARKDILTVPPEELMDFGRKADMEYEVEDMLAERETE